MIRIVRLGTPRHPDEGPRIGTVRRPPHGVPEERRMRIGFSKAILLSPWHPEPDQARRLVRFNLFSEAAAA
jgi:uncharacterized protein YeaO (DUF488 family)